ncbi:hypothetical protein UACE39S_03933 [Ureibacillus acetophenoni]
MLIKPKKLNPGDRVATVSPSWGGAGELELRWRYEQGVKRLEEVFGLEVVPMPNSLKGADYLYQNPQARAEDLMTAFKDESIKGIIANIGGDDSIRLLPYIEFNVIRENPKIFMGYSDVTISHLFCLKAGISSFYGPAILTDFAENVEMDPYTVEMVYRTLFSNEVIGEIQPANKWTSERLEWVESNKNQRRTMNENTGYELLQGTGVVQGRLIGGMLALKYAVLKESSLTKIIVSGAAASIRYNTDPNSIYNNQNPNFNRIREIMNAFNDPDLPVEERKKLSREWTLMSFYKEENLAKAYEKPSSAKTVGERLDYFRKVDCQSYDVTEQIKQVTIPAYVCSGLHDAQCPYRFGVEIADLIPNATLTTFEQSNHYPFWEEEQTFNEFVKLTAETKQYSKKVSN